MAKFFETVLHVGIVTEVISRRKGFYYKVRYGDGDQEDMDEDELIYAIQLKEKKDAGEELTNEDESNDVLSGLSEEGSEYDSEEDRKALKEAKKKRKPLVDIDKKAGPKKKRNPKIKWTVCPESVAHIGGLESIFGKSMSRYVSLSRMFLARCTKNKSTLISLDADGLEEVCFQIAKPMKKAVRKTMEEAVFLVSNLCHHISLCFNYF